MIKTETFVRSVPRQFVRALKMMPKTGNGQKQNGKALHSPRRHRCGWLKIRFKLHLRPNDQSNGYVSNKIPSLPIGKSAIDIFADFLRYLHRCARTYIEETHANGVDLWQTLEDRTEFVLTHPNGWEGAQQSMMRTAAVKAGLIPDNEDGHSRLSFVTEGEASLHFCVQSGLTNDAIKVDFINFVSRKNIVDTLTAEWQRTSYCRCWRRNHRYKCLSTNFSSQPVIRRDSRTSMYAAIVVILRFILIMLDRPFPWIYLCNKSCKEFSRWCLLIPIAISVVKSWSLGLLGKSRFSGDIPHIAKIFDKTTKLRFRNADEPHYIKFGSIRDRDPLLNIRSGQLKLLGYASEIISWPGMHYIFS